jgi:steroid delta-isomerase-like uncharacterized protein
MAVQRNAARRFFEDVIGTGDWSQADEIASPDMVMHHPSSPTPIGPRDNVRDVLLGFRTAFPDIQFAVDDEIDGGDKVVVRWHANGTNTGSLFGAPPTGKSMRVSGISVFRIESGRVVEDWVEEDALGVMQQLGLPVGS